MLFKEPDEDQQFKLASSRPKSIDEILADSDEDIDGTCNDEPSESRKKSGLNANKKKTRESYITENSDGIVDLLDPSAAQVGRLESKQSKLNALNIIGTCIDGDLVETWSPHISIKPLKKTG